MRRWSDHHHLRRAATLGGVACDIALDVGENLTGLYKRYCDEIDILLNCEVDVQPVLQLKKLL
jgi:hypothetical protein